MGERALHMEHLATPAISLLEAFPMPNSGLLVRSSRGHSGSMSGIVGLCPARLWCPKGVGRQLPALIAKLLVPWALRHRSSIADRVRRPYQGGTLSYTW